MKKYRISRFYRGFYLSALFFMLALEIMFILMTIFLCDETARIYTLDIHIIEILVIALLLYMFFFDIPTGKYSIADDRLSLYVGFRHYDFVWDELVHRGAFGFDAGNRGVRLQSLWFFLSKSFVTDKERDRMMAKTRKEFRRLAVLEFNEESFGQILEKLPEKLRADLEFDMETLSGEYTYWRGRYTSRPPC